MHRSTGYLDTGGPFPLACRAILNYSDLREPICRLPKSVGLIFVMLTSRGPISTELITASQIAESLVDSETLLPIYLTNLNGDGNRGWED
jgi:hypothetical protein